MSDKQPNDLVIEPRENNVYLLLDEIPNKTAGGLWMADEQATPTRIGTVLAVGPGKVDNNGKLIPVLYKPGDRVLIQSFSGDDIYLWQYGIRDGRYRIQAEHTIYAKVLKE